MGLTQSQTRESEEEPLIEKLIPEEEVQPPPAQEQSFVQWLFGLTSQPVEEEPSVEEIISGEEIQPHSTQNRSFMQWLFGTPSQPPVSEDEDEFKSAEELPQPRVGTSSQSSDDEFESIEETFAETPPLPETPRSLFLEPQPRLLPSPDRAILSQNEIEQIRRNYYGDLREYLDDREYQRFINAIMRRGDITIWTDIINDFIEKTSEAFRLVITNSNNEITELIINSSNLNYILDIFGILTDKRIFDQTTNVEIKENENFRLLDMIEEGKFNAFVTAAMNRITPITADMVDYFINLVRNNEDYYVLHIVYRNENDRPVHRPVKNVTAGILYGVLNTGIEEEEIETLGSDTMNNFGLKEVTSLSVHKYNECPIQGYVGFSPAQYIGRGVRDNQDGAFFPYFNTTDLDLSRYQIWTEEESKKVIKEDHGVKSGKLSKNQKDIYKMAADDPKNEEFDESVIEKSVREQVKDERSLREHCLLHTLKMLGIPQETIDAIKIRYVGAKYITIKELPKLADYLERDIVRRRISDKGVMRKNIYKTKNAKYPPVVIAMYKNHYFVFEKTEYSVYFIEHYKEMKYAHNRETGGSYYVRNKGAKIDSLRLVHTLFKAGYFVKGDMTIFEESMSHPELKDHVCLDNIDKEQRKVEMNFFTKTEREYYEKLIELLNQDNRVDFYSNKDKVKLYIVLMKSKETYKPKIQQPLYTQKDVDKFKKLRGMLNEQILQDQPDIEEITATLQLVTYGKILEQMEANEDYIGKEMSKFKSYLDDINKHPDNSEETMKRFIDLLCRYKTPRIGIAEEMYFEDYLKKTYREHEIYFADTETYVETEDLPHRLYLLGFVGSTTEIPTIYDISKLGGGKEGRRRAVMNFLRDITHNGKHNCMVYFHNLKYDYHILEEFLNVRYECEKDGTMYSVTVSFGRNCEVVFRDSYKIIPLGLGNFNKTLGLDKHQKKEYISYKYYNQFTAKTNIVRVVEYAELLPVKDRIPFKEEVKKHNSYRVEKGVEYFLPTKWYHDYLKEDCLTLKEGIRKFDQMLLGITDGQISVHDRMTISSLTNLFMKMEGAFDGMYEMTSNLKAYVGKAIVGGRNHCNPKYVCKEVRGKIADFDCCSQYPSAISRYCREKGFAKGKAKRLLRQDFSKWEDYHYSVMTVKITKVNKNQQMPFIAVKKSDGSMDYTNEVPEHPLIMDCITLREYIDYHHIEYDISDGVYWDEGGNRRMGEIIERLYDERSKVKASNPGLSQVLKLMMNSSYGKTIIKPSETETRLIPKEKWVWDEKQGKCFKDPKVSPWQNYILNHSNRILEYREMNNGKKIKVKLMAIDTSYNLAHVGCAILSMSKRIMNEVFDTCNDLLVSDLGICESGNPIGTNYYTDTDSMHIDCQTIKPLADRYIEKYGRELIGKQLGQFHSDFNLEGSVGEIYSEIFVLLGKKSYLDCLVGYDVNGDEIRGFHPRLKGQTEAGLSYESKKYIDYYLGLYRELATGVEKKILLNPYNPETCEEKVLFEFKHGRVWTKKPFHRTVQFGTPATTSFVVENSLKTQGPTM